MTDRHRPARPGVAVLGAGVVGARVARELISSPDAPLVTIVSSRADRVRALREAFGADAVVLHSAAGHAALPGSVRVVVLAGEPEGQAGVARHHLQLGRHVVSSADVPETVAELLDLHDEARAAALSVVAGAAFSPGLSCLLAAHAALGLDTVDEVHVARHGAGGPLCARERLRSMRATTKEWRDGAWVAASSGSGRELCWFPDPVGPRDCYRVATGEALLLVDAFAGLHRATVRMAMSRRDRLMLPLPILLPAPPEGGVGALRVEVRGSRDGARRTEVLGCLDRPGMAAGAVAAEATLGLLRGEAPAGAHGLAAWGRSTELLAALRVRGVRVATLDGE